MLCHVAPYARRRNVSRFAWENNLEVRVMLLHEPKGKHGVAVVDVWILLGRTGAPDVDVLVRCKLRQVVERLTVVGESGIEKPKIVLLKLFP